MQRPAPLAALPFPLGILAPRLSALRPPAGPFDPRGDWRLAYGVYTMAGGAGSRVGALRLARKAGAGEAFALSVDYDKIVVAGNRQRVTARLHCRADRLATPGRWTFTSRLIDSSGVPIPDTLLEKSATVVDGQIEIDDGRSKRRLPVPQAYTVNWALLEAVTRLPREPFGPLEFTLLDHFDQLKPGQTLGYRESVRVGLGGQTARLEVYDQVGRGVVPWVYGCDEQGRPLLAASGLEAYLLEPPPNPSHQPRSVPTA